MKIRSKQLRQFLSDAGVLDGTPESIQAATAAYRRKYKTEWERKKAARNCIVRTGFTRAQFEVIKVRAKLYGLSITAYVRSVTIAAQENVSFIPRRPDLLEILKYVSMAENALLNDDAAEAQALVLQAEEKLMDYLNTR